jgi:hypothetical protein
VVDEMSVRYEERKLFSKDKKSTLVPRPTDTHLQLSATPSTRYHQKNAIHFLLPRK